MVDWRSEFTVIKRFRDKENTSKVWQVGELYSRSGEGKKARIEELAGSKNAEGEPFIEEVPDHNESSAEETEPEEGDS